MVIVEKSTYKYGRLPGRHFINGNEISWTFQTYVCTTKPPVIAQNLPNKYGNLPYSNVKSGNWISTYDWAYAYHRKLTMKSSMVSLLLLETLSQEWWY